MSAVCRSETYKPIIRMRAIDPSETFGNRENRFNFSLLLVSIDMVLATRLISITWEFG